jgi:RNA polymerase sigma-70 factor (ECF subfamily)
METTATDLFERYHVTAYRYFRRATGSHDIAQDLTQELFLRVVRHLKSYKAGRGEAGWIFRIARNLLVDHRRKHPPLHVALADAHGLGTQPTQVLAFGLSEALELLSESDREVFLLREVAGLSYAELAHACDTTVENVRSRVCRARCRLRGLLGARLAADENKRRNQDG